MTEILLSVAEVEDQVRRNTLIKPEVVAQLSKELQEELDELERELSGDSSPKENVQNYSEPSQTPETKGADESVKTATIQQEESKDEEEWDAEELKTETYDFPAKSLASVHPLTSHLSQEDLVEWLEEIISDDDQPYSSIRDEACAIHIELNRRLRLAPRFRPARKIPREAKNPDHVLLSRDRQFIDLHWLHASGYKKTIIDDRASFRRMLTGRELKKLAAEQFAVAPLKADTKATWLALPDQLAFQLAAIQTDTVRERFRVSLKGKKDAKTGKLAVYGRHQIEVILRNSVSHLPQLQRHVPTWVDIWHAARLVGDKAEPLRKFHALMTGLETPMDRRDIVRRLGNLERHIRSYKKLKTPPESISGDELGGTS